MSSKKIETLTIPYRLPNWDGGDHPVLRPAELTVHRVTVTVGGAELHHVSRELAAEFGPPPELFRRQLCEQDQNRREKTSVLLVTTDPGPFVAEEKRLLDGYFAPGVPMHAYKDPWRFYLPITFDPDPRNGWLVRLGDEVVRAQPRIDVTGRPDLIACGEERRLPFEREGDRVYLREGDYLRAETGLVLTEWPVDPLPPWAPHEFLHLHPEVPYVQAVIEDFRAGRPLPETWARLNLAYAIRRVWFERQLFTHRKFKQVDQAIAHECSLFGENVRL